MKLSDIVLVIQRTWRAHRFVNGMAQYTIVVCIAKIFFQIEITH